MLMTPMNFFLVSVAAYLAPVVALLMTFIGVALVFRFIGWLDL